MQSEVTELSPTEVELKVEIPWERVSEGLETSLRRLGQSARVKGFRPGKVPKRVLRQLFGRQVRADVAAELVERGLIEAVTKHALQVVARPELDDPEVQDGQPLAFSAKIQVRPKLGELDFSKLEVTRPDTEVPTSAVDEALDRLREEHVELRAPDPMRPAQKSDELTIDYTVTIDGEDKPDMSAEGRTVVLGNDSLNDSFEEGLNGVQPGDSTDIVLDFPEDHGREELAGKSATFHVNVKELKERILPEVDDEFAKDVGDFETLLELRLDLRKRLEAERERQGESDLRERILDKLIETHDVPVPDAMLAEQKQAMLMQLAQLAQASGAGADLLSELAGRLDESAERKVKGALLMGAVAEQNSLEVLPDDVDGKLQEIAEATGKHIAKVRVDYSGERRDQLENMILEEKIAAFLREKTRLVDPPPEAEAEESGSDQEAEDPTGEGPNDSEG